MPAPAAWARHPAVVAILIAVALIVAATILALFPVAQRWAGDIRLFEQYASMTFSGELGETPFLSWYPPLALIPLGIPLLAGGGWVYAFAFGVEMAAFASAGGLLVGGLREGAGDRLRVVAAYAALVVVAAALVVWRYDIVPAVLTVAALWATTRGRWALAGAMLGLAGGLKLYAAVLAPLLVLHAWRTGGAKAAVRAGATGGLVGMGSVAAYALFPGSSPLDLLSFTASRPLHLESVPGAVIAALAMMGATVVDIELSFGSFNVTGSAADDSLAALRVLQPLVLALSLGAGSYAIWRQRPLATDTVVLAWMAALLGLVVANRVVSPQYLLWVLPLIPLTRGLVRWAMVGAIVLGALIFPWLYKALLELEPMPVTLALLRNLLLIVAWLAAMLHLIRTAVGRHSASAAVQTT